MPVTRLLSLGFLQHLMRSTLKQRTSEGGATMSARPSRNAIQMLLLSALKLSQLRAGSFGGGEHGDLALHRAEQQAVRQNKAAEDLFSAKVKAKKLAKK